MFPAECVHSMHLSDLSPVVPWAGNFPCIWERVIHSLCNNYSPLCHEMGFSSGENCIELDFNIDPLPIYGNRKRDRERWKEDKNDDRASWQRRRTEKGIHVSNDDSPTNVPKQRESKETTAKGLEEKEGILYIVPRCSLHFEQ
jgi:hypothetical protein